ncbi:hypothetical protein PPROV_000414300 [Pycnococcus provasolii]|uniref:Formate dehydrogenase n=2 Tax=Pycnococcus provasolii TaxID=41880 RepID=A0A830HF87_9CHLO|nr:hypothetical protein PPROV_000414300 [Pycnococcus provasolii]
MSLISLASVKMASSSFSSVVARLNGLMTTTTTATTHFLKKAPAVATTSCMMMMSSTPRRSIKVLAALYPDPLCGYPPEYARTNVPTIKDTYADGTRLPTPKSKPEYTPGELLGCVSGELGLRSFLEKQGHTLVVTSDKDGEESEFEKHLHDADVVISQPFWPAYLDEARLAKAKKLQLVITAGVGSDHVDLKACKSPGVQSGRLRVHSSGTTSKEEEEKKTQQNSDKNKPPITVAEVSFCNSISVAEHVVMLVLVSVRNFVNSHEMARVTSNGTQKSMCGAYDDGWNIADLVQRAYDLEGMHVGTVGAGRIGLAVLRRLKPFDVTLHYTDFHRLDKSVEQELNLTFHETPQELAQACDVITINCPLHSGTEKLFDDDMIRNHMRRGAYLINTARGLIVDRDAVVRALNDGHLSGYGGDVWFPQPAPLDHPWRTMPWSAMTPHMSGSTLSAQARYAAGVREILECFLAKKPIRDEYLIVHGGRLAGAGRHSYIQDCHRKVEDEEWEEIHGIPA